MDGRARVLVIDDEPHLGKLLARMLDREHAVTVVPSGHEAIEGIAMGNGFELILCDVMMPQMTGIGFYERLSAVAPELVERVVFLTGGAFTPEAQAFLQQPFIHHIEKPFPLAEFRLAVMAHLQRLGRRR